MDSRDECEADGVEGNSGWIVNSCVVKVEECVGDLTLDSEGVCGEGVGV